MALDLLREKSFLKFPYFQYFCLQQMNFYIFKCVIINLFFFFFFFFSFAIPSSFKYLYNVLLKRNQCASSGTVNTHGKIQ